MKLASYFLLLFFVFSSVVIPSLPAHTQDSNPAFSLSTFCSPMHIHVRAQYTAGYGAPDNLEISERKQRELTALVKRRLVTARLYQERAENYVSISVLRNTHGPYVLRFDFWKLLYDRATQSWGYASTWGFEQTGVLAEDSEWIRIFSGQIDSFLEQYVDVNKTSCSR